MKKGFTLIELLAVIVILAVIALIAVPIIINIIDDAKKEAAVRSAEGYVRAVNYKIAQEVLNNREVDETVDYVIGENELAVTGNNLDGITGSYSLSNNRVLWAGLCVNHYSISYSNGVSAIDKTGNYCNEEEPYVFIEPEAELLSNVCSNEGKYSETKFKIKTVEDLVCLSNLVNSGKNFADKEIYLLSDIDFNNDSSYKDKNTTVYGDINGDNNTEGLKIELTTGRGFKPIGNNTNKFSGTFLGYAFTISNLMINRETAYLGLFGYNTGTISGVKLRNVSITSTKTTSAYVGGIAGHSAGNITSVDVEGTITGIGNDVAGIVGYVNKSAGGLNVESVLFKGSVTGESLVGGIVGNISGTDNNHSTLKGVVYDSTMTATYSGTGNSMVGIVAGSAGSYVDRDVKNYSSTYTATKSRYSGLDGNSLQALTLEGVDGALDTYIGGDNDSDHYYFDYDNEGNITLFSTDRTPIQNKLKGTGTDVDPYLIRNDKDWKMASALGTQSKYFSVTSNIDFNNKNYYVLGTNNNRFNGHINGNMHAISNISLYGYSHLGLFGYNQGTIEGFRLNNINISATGQYVAGIAGYNTGTIRGIKLRNATISSTSTEVTSYIGGIAGQSAGNITSIDVEGTITGNGNNVGGIAGYVYKSAGGLVVDNALFKGTVTGSNQVGGLVGNISGKESNYSTLKGVVYDSTINATYSGSGNVMVGKSAGSIDTYITKNVKNCSSTYTSTKSRYSGFDGNLVQALTLEGVDGALDTYIGGDNDSDHYYFDYDNEGNITLFSTKTTPIQNTLNGSGTENDPYIINNENDWKMASALGTQSKYFVVTKDIDFTDKKYYVLGTNTNRFNGHINGNMHAISNINLYGYDYLGLFGYNTGTIEGFSFNNINVSATGQYVAGIAGYNTGTIKGIELKNATISSTSTEVSTYVAGIAGQSAGNITSVDVEGTITGNGNNIGGIAGYVYKSAGGLVVDNALFKGTVIGSSQVGGLVGNISGKESNYSTLKGVVYDSTITATYSGSGNVMVGKSAGSIDTYITKNVKNCSSTYTSTKSRYSGFDGTSLSIFEIESVDGALDTPVNGDDGDGYYFDYDSNNVITLYSVAEKPVRKLSGSGTESDPYQISSADDWNLAALSNYSSSTYYVITNDIDFTGKTIYPMGTSSRKFNGHINGNMYTLSNMSVNGTGIFEYNQGTIEGIKFNNITITSTVKGTGLIGTNEGTVKGVEVKNLTINATISSGDLSHTGGLVGINKGLIKTVVVEGNITSNKWRVGGIVGYNNAEIDGAVFKGSINTSEAVGGLVGKSDEVVSGKSLRVKGFVYNTTITATVSNTNMGKTIGSAVSTTHTTKNMNITLVGTRQTGYYVDGTEINELITANISDVIDTTDGDSDGYYFVISNGNLELVKD